MAANWDETTPAGTDPLSEGDDRIRELKAALTEALSHENTTFPGATPGSTPILIPGIELGVTGLRPTGDSLVSGRFYANTTLNIIERYNGSTWDSVATNVPAGSKAMFYQASAPVGWTAVAVNDKFLRVVTSGGTGGTTGGSVAASTTLAHTHTVDGHTHSISSDGGHTHTFPGSSASLAGGSGYSNTTSSNGAHDHGGATGSTAPGTDSQISGAFAYADVIIATKD